MFHISKLTHKNKIGQISDDDITIDSNLTIKKGDISITPLGNQYIRILAIRVRYKTVCLDIGYGIPYPINPKIFVYSDTFMNDSIYSFSTIYDEEHNIVIIQSSYLHDELTDIMYRFFPLIISLFFDLKIMFKFKARGKRIRKINASLAGDYLKQKLSRLDTLIIKIEQFYLQNYSIL